MFQNKDKPGIHTRENMDMSDEINTLSQLFAMSRDAVIGVKDSTVVFANPSAEALFSLRVGDAATEHLPEYILSDSAERFYATMKHGEKSYDISVSRQDGLALVCVYRPASAPADSDASAGWSRALKELGSDLFAARLAIDTIVKNTNAEEDPKLRDYAAVFYRSYYRMKRLHDHMLTVSCIVQNELPYTPAIIRLDDLCRDVCDTVSQLIRPLEIALTFTGGDEPSYIMADARLLETMLLNLLSNSLLHTKGGDRIDVTLTRSGQRYVLAVDDSGSGIAPERMRELFGEALGGIPDAASGAGLGLAVVRGIAERHGGALIAESRPDKGTSFRISLPCPDPDDVQLLRQPAPSYRADGMNTVLTELSVVLDRSFYNRKMFD